MKDTLTIHMMRKMMMMMINNFIDYDDDDDVVTIVFNHCSILYDNDERVQLY